MMITIGLQVLLCAFLLILFLALVYVGFHHVRILVLVCGFLKLLIHVFFDVWQRLDYFVVFHDINFAWIFDDVVILFILGLLHDAAQLLPKLHERFLDILRDFDIRLTNNILNDFTEGQIKGYELFLLAKVSTLPQSFHELIRGDQSSLIILQFLVISL